MAEFISNHIETRQIKDFKLGQTLLYSIICIICSQITVFEYYMPFGIAVYCALQLRHQKSWIVSLFTCASMMLLNTDEKLWYVGMVTIVFLTSISMQPRQKISTGGAMVIAGILTGVIMALQSILNGQLVIIILRNTITGTTLAVSTVYLFDIAVENFKQIGRGVRHQPKDHIAMISVLALCTLGLQKTSISMINLGQVFIAIVVMIVAHRGKGEHGALLGILLGGIVVAFGNMPAVVTISLCLAAIIAGQIDARRFVFVVTFVAVFVISLALFIDYTLIIPYLMFMSIGASVVLIMPQVVYQKLDEMIVTTEGQPKAERTYTNKVRKLMINNLIEFAEAHRQLANHFEDLITADETFVTNEAEELIACMTETACNGCSKFNYCWEKYSKKLLKIMIEMAATLEKEGAITVQKLPKEFLSTCQYPAQMCDWLNQAYLQYKLDEEWSENIRNHRQLTVKQLIGISEAASNLALKVKKEFKLLPEWEEEIKQILGKHNILCRSVTVAKRDNDGYEVMICVDTDTEENINKKAAIIEEQVTIMMQVPMKIKRINIYPKGICEIELIRATTYTIVTSVIRKPKTVIAECGDNYCDTEINGNRQLLCISDGMGSGLQAAQESNTVVELVEDFMQAGYGIAFTVDTINSILSIRTNQETFATADICEIDLQTGFAKIVKVGAPPTFIKRKRGVEVIEINNLPIGILDYVDMKTLDISLNSNDMVIMMSDGVRDALIKNERTDDEIINLINSFETGNPDMIAKIIMEAAETSTEDDRRDDMTVMVARVMES